MSKMQGWTLITLIAVILGIAIWQLFGAPTRWQYAIESTPDSQLAALLTKVGADGWEMVSARRATTPNPPNPEKPDAMYEMIFKRSIKP